MLAPQPQDIQTIIDAAVEVATAAMLGRGGVEVGQQAHQRGE
jgi:hypothetical protein